jgi:malate dehydrogenase (oxaloacetate-decarboxylating)(NADP+)
VIFAEAEEEVVLRAAIQYREFGYGTPVLVGRTQAGARQARRARSRRSGAFEIENSVDSALVPQMVAHLYERLQRRGYTERDVRRMVNQDRNTFASLLLALGHGDAMISGSRGRSRRRCAR